VGPVSGGDVVYARGRDIKALDTNAIGDVDSLRTLLQVYERLFGVGPDGAPIPQLATNYTTSADGLTWTFTLLSGVTFSDGTPMTSADFKFSIDRARAGASFKFIDACISGVDAPDPLTLTITTSAPCPSLLAALASYINVVYPKDFQGKSEAEFFQHPIGTGPFMFDHWTQGQEVKIVKNPKFRDPSRPYLDSVTFRLVGEDTTRLLQIKAGDIQIDQEPAFTSLDELNSTEGTVGMTYPIESTRYILFNTKVKPLDDVHVRRAIAYALDRQAMVDAIVLGHGTVANSFVNPALPFYSKDTVGLPFDLEKAKAELAQSTVPNGFDIEFMVPGDHPVYAPIADITQQALKPLGINVTIRKIEFTNLFTEIAKYNYQISVEAWTSDLPDISEQAGWFGDFTSAGSYYTAYQNPDVAQWIQEAGATLDTATRATLYKKVQDQLATDVPVISLWYEDLPYGLSSRIQGFSVVPTGEFRMEDVWLTP
jgi:peptide/nickel transport system substrate-binding protein